ncbi:MAG: hypothetical protein AAGA77_25285 [Bacteroidota bacterium]
METIVNLCWALAVFIIPGIFFLIGVERLATHKAKSGYYFLFSISWFMTFLFGVMFFGGEQESEVLLGFPIFAIILFGSVRRMYDKSFFPALRVTKNGERAFNLIYKKIFVGFMVFILTSFFCLLVLGVEPSPTLKIGGVFSVFSIVIHIISNDV